MVSVTASALGCQGCKSLAKLSHVGPTQQSCPLPPLPQMLLTLPLPPKRNTVHIVEPASGTTSTTYNDHFPTPIFRCDGFDEPPSLSIPSSPLTCSHSQLTQTSKIQLPKSCSPPLLFNTFTRFNNTNSPPTCPRCGETSYECASHENPDDLKTYLRRQI